MKAVECTQYGPPEVLQLKELEKPVPKDNEVLINVHAATVNRTDCALLRAKPFVARFVTGIFKPKKHISGIEFAGKIEAVGKNVTSYKVGDRVFGFDDSGLGSHAEYMTISQDKALTTIPEDTTYRQAAASIEGAYYAYNFINKVNLESGQQILVNGATGAIGSAAIQLLDYYGANVTAVCKGKHFDLVKSLGANEVIDYTQDDFTAHERTYSFVFDTVGKSSFAKCKPLLGPGGAYISSELGYMAQNLFFALTTPKLGNKKVIFPLPTDCRGSILFIKKLMEEGKFKAVIDRDYPLEQIVEAYTYVEKGQKVGNVVIMLEHNRIRAGLT
jgi:NADPH:quinone reductase-like Zn-dependent oxidoreductase